VAGGGQRGGVSGGIDLHYSFCDSSPFTLLMPSPLGFVAVQFVGAHLVFSEAITTNQWLGIALIAGGVVIVSLGR